MRRLALAATIAVAAGIAAGFALHQLRSAPAEAAGRAALPLLHGQATWKDGARPAPPLQLRDQNGKQVSLRALRGHPVLLTFMDSQCKAECPVQGRQLGTILRALPAAQRPTLVVVGVNPSGDTRPSIEHAMRTWTLAGPWEWHWLRGSRSALAAVWKEYGVTVDPASGDIVHSLVLYLIDARGDERTAYLYPFLPAFVQRDLATLAEGTAA